MKREYLTRVLASAERVRAARAEYKRQVSEAQLKLETE